MNRRDIITIPNILSMIRVAFIPLIVLTALKAEYHLTVGLFILSAITDVADGYIARHFDMGSNVGKVLDPLADKLTQAALILCLIVRYHWMISFFILFALKELIVLLFGYLSVKYSGRYSGSKWYGKLSTVVLFAVFSFMLLIPDEWGKFALPAAIVGCVFLTVSMVLYVILFVRMMCNARKKDNSKK